MKQAIIIGVALFLGVSTTYAGVKLVKGEEFAQIGVGSDMVIVSKFVDGSTTCYVSRHGKFGSHSISCVK
jgi:hypothetical protein